MDEDEDAYRNSEAGRHSVKVVGVFGHGGDLGHDCGAGPFDSKDFGELLEVLRAGLTDAEHSIAEPRHAQTAELLVEELHAQLRCQQWNILNDRQTDTPLLVFCQLDNGRQERLREELDSNNVVDLFQLGDDVEANIREVVLEHLQEHGKEMFGGFLLAEDGSKTADLSTKGSTDMLRGVSDEILDGGHDFAEEGLLFDELAETYENQYVLVIMPIPCDSYLVFGQQSHS